MTWLSSQCLPKGWIQSQDVTFVLVIKYVADSRADTYSTKVQLLSTLRIQEKTRDCGRKPPPSGNKTTCIDSCINYYIVKNCLHNSRISRQLLTISRVIYKLYHHS